MIMVHSITVGAQTIFLVVVGMSRYSLVCANMFNSNIFRRLLQSASITIVRTGVMSNGMLCCRHIDQRNFRTIVVDLRSRGSR